MTEAETSDVMRESQRLRERGLRSSREEREERNWREKRLLELQERLACLEFVGVAIGALALFFGVLGIAIYFLTAKFVPTTVTFGKDPVPVSERVPCAMPSFEPKHPDFFVPRPAVYERFDEAYRNHEGATDKPCFVVYGATGSGKTKAIHAWLSSRGHVKNKNVISVMCDRTSNGWMIWRQIGVTLQGCSPEDAQLFVVKNRPILHLTVNSEDKDSPNAGKAFLNIGRNFAEYSFIILDLSPRSVDVTNLPPQGTRFEPLVVPEFNVSEAVEFLSKANQSNPFPRWLPRAAHNGKNDTLANQTMRRIAEVTVGTNPLKLYVMVKTNITEEFLENERNNSLEDARKKLAKLTAEERRVIRDLVSVAYDDGIRWPTHTIMPAEFHRFPMLRSLLHGKLEAQWRLYFRSVVEHYAYNATIWDFMLTGRVRVFNLNDTTRGAIDVNVVEIEGGKYTVDNFKDAIHEKLERTRNLKVDLDFMVIQKRVGDGPWSVPLSGDAPLAANESMSFGWKVSA